MAIPRKQLICLEQTQYYHCISRCVRRAFLCGKDPHSLQSFEHRREWIEALLIKLSNVFCIDILAYAIMSNHYHIVLHVNIEQAQNLSNQEIIQRWGTLFRTPDLDHASEETINQYCQSIRQNLCNISRFFAYLNEKVARRANAEDQCKGRFWEGRFQSQALLDQTALLRCMTYVELNPIRAGIKQTPETSEFTSIHRRIHKQKTQLAPFQDQIKDCLNKESARPFFIPINFNDYLQLVEWSGRIIRVDKTGYIPNTYPDILQRLNVSQDTWKLSIQHKPRGFQRAIGTAHKVKQYCQRLGLRWIWQNTQYQTE